MEYPQFTVFRILFIKNFINIAIPTAIDPLISSFLQGLNEVREIPQKIIDDTRGTRNGKLRDLALRMPFICTWIAHFGVLVCLCVNASLSAKPLIWKCVSATSSFSCKSNSFSFEKFWDRSLPELGNGLLNKVNWNKLWGPKCHLEC